jgi:hypothetical protein
VNRRDLERIEIPGEHDARGRSWEVVRAAFEGRERVTWPRRHGRSLLLAAAGVAVVAAAVTPPGRSVVNSFRDAVGREKVVGVRPAHRELVRLPTTGKLLVESPDGAWIVNENGARRRLGPYRMASWSPHAKFVAAVSDFELHALDPLGNGRWAKGRKQRMAYPRWSYEGFRIAYFSENTLRVIWGNGEHDRSLGNADPSVPPAWQPGTHTVAWLGADGDVRVADADDRRPPARIHPVRPIVALAWADGELASIPRRMPGIPGTAVSVALRPKTNELAAVVRVGNRSRVYLNDRLLFSGAGRMQDLAWSPDGRWLLVPWESADQFVFVRVGAKPKLVAVSNIARQFDPGAVVPAFPRVDGWCCVS